MNYIAAVATGVVAAILAGVLIVACNQYEKVPENSPFIVSCSVSNGTATHGADVEFSIVDGSIKGDCRLNLTLKNTLTGQEVVGYQLRTPNGTVIDNEDTWSFDKDGVADFVLTGLSSGSYLLRATIVRWYHSATAEANFTITN